MTLMAFNYEIWVSKSMLRMDLKKSKWKYAIMR